MPRYKKREVMPCLLSNQVCVIKDGKFLKFPDIKQTLNIGKVGVQGTLQQVRLLPMATGEITLEVVLKQPLPEHAVVREKGVEADSLVHEPKRILSIDFGVDVLAACVDNTGCVPLLICGKTLKSINQGYNKLRAFYTSALRNGKQPNQGPFTSRHLEKLTALRNRRVDDYLHKASAQIVRIAVERGIDTIIVGKNKGWKQDVTLRNADKQTFIQIPHARLYTLIKYKAERAGIQVGAQEESYTSKACFLSDDSIPVYGTGDAEKATFSGTRKKRAWYHVHACSTEWHADLNAAGNILRKAFPHAFDGCDRRSLLQPPQVIRIS